MTQIHNMTKRPLVSIIIPNLNGEKVLPLCLTSLCNQTLDKSFFEIIIVDNGSSDNSINIVRNFLKRCNINIKIIPLKKNLGFGKAINIGSLNSEAPFLLITNNDIIFHPKYLENLLNIFLTVKSIDKSIVAAQGLHMFYPEVNCIYNAGGLASIIGYPYRYYGICLSRDEFNKIIEWINTKTKYDYMFTYTVFPNGAGTLIQRDVFLKLGGYSHLYFSGIEEIDLGILLYLTGHKTIFIPSAVLYHMESFTLGGGGVFIPKKLYLILLGLLTLISSMYNIKRLILALYCFITANIGLLFISLIKHDLLLSYAIIRAIKLYPKLLRISFVRRILIRQITTNPFEKILLFFKKWNLYLHINKYVIFFIKSQVFRKQKNI